MQNMSATRCSLPLPFGYRQIGGSDELRSVLLPHHVHAELEAAKNAVIAGTRCDSKEEVVDLFKEFFDESPKSYAELEDERILSKRVQIFDFLLTSKALDHLKIEDDDKSARLIPILESALLETGLRPLITEPLPDLIREIKRLVADMPNFESAATLLCAEIALAMSSEPKNFRVTCICLDGPPGVGKTRFAKELSRILDVGFEQISMGATSGSFELAGLAPGWATSRPGRIAKILASGKTACPVVLLDEIDKTSSDPRYSPLTVLLDLLEKDTASRFRDECLEIEIDASKIIFIATSNDAERIPSPLLSRMRIVDVPAPTKEQRHMIISNIARDFNEIGMTFSDEIVEALSKLDMDLRGLAQFVRELVGKTLMAGEINVRIEDFPQQSSMRHGIGFIR